jgi:K+-transporting ATPase ATPase C chain
MSEDQLRSFIGKHTAQRQLGFLGEPGVNVLELNLDLDQHFPATKRAEVMH